MSKRTNIHSFERKKAKQADRRRPHRDKYAPQASGTKAETKPEATDDNH